MNSGFANEWLALISGAWTAVEWKGLDFKGLQELSGPDLSETAAAWAWLTDVPIYRLDWHVADKKAGSDWVFHMSPQGQSCQVIYEDPILRAIKQARLGQTTP